MEGGGREAGWMICGRRVSVDPDVCGMSNDSVVRWKGLDSGCWNRSRESGITRLLRNDNRLPLSENPLSISKLWIGWDC